MNPVWQPALNPPKLDEFSDLSPDAQLIMASLTKKYLQIQELQRPQADPGIYYRRNYAARFGRDAVSQDYHNRSYESNTSNTCNTSTEMDVSPTIENQDYQKQSEFPKRYCASKSDLSDAFPPIETQDYVRLSHSQKQKQFTAENNEKPERRKQNNAVSPSLFSQDLEDVEFLPRSLLFACHENVDPCPLNRASSPEKQDNHLSMELKKENTINDSETHNLLASSCKQNTDYLATDGNQSKYCNEIHASNSNILCKKLDINEHDEGHIDKNDFGMDFSLTSSEIIRVEARFDDKISRQCTAADRVAVKEKSLGIKRGQLEMAENAGLISKNQISTSEVLGTNKSSSISKKLAYLRIPQRTLSQFCTPYKKQKLDPNTEKPYTTDTIWVSNLSEKRLMEICSCILNSKEVLLTLLLDENTSQLSDDGASDSKRKQNLKARDLENQKVPSSHLIFPDTMPTSPNINLLLLSPSNETVYNIFKTFWDELMRCDSRKVCYNYCFDATSVSTCWTVLDPMVAMWILDPDRPAMSFPQIVTALNISQQVKLMSTPSMAAINRDLRNLSTVMKELYQRLMAQDMWELFYKVEMKLTPILAAMEITELKIDTLMLGRFSDVLKKKLLLLEQKAHECVGHTFSMTSHLQLRQVLFEELRLNAMLPQATKLTKTSVGHEPSTSEVALNQLTKYHPLPGIILEHRQLQKLKCTYVDGILSCVKNDKLLTHWDQTAAATGRVTSFQPNVQSIPKVPVTIISINKSYVIDEEKEVEIFARDPFISHEGYSFMAADFQQIELRLLAHLASDPILLQIFNNPESPDIFNELTSQWLSKPALEVTNAEREQTKRVVYSIMYGAGKEKLAEYFGVSVDIAKAMMTSFQAKFPAASEFSKKCISFCQKNGYTTTIFKRRRKFRNIHHPASHLSAQAERQAINFCVQGSAADLCKAAMIQLQLALNCRHHLKARLLIQIHDEILLEVADEHINEVKDIVKRVMESGDSLCGHMAKLKVPIKVSISVGKRWGHMNPIS
ncbi:hypothetical protein ACJMK2_006798 [Sinanodonta woodiana]|uniref:DNA-directed DNA polymerase family A palm domain-containing protein n=1 Tax=Sinanodonta woodiana TaxID=1069815 RepID=A0ABD3VVM1_SINWO